MSETIVKVPIGLKELDASIRALSETASFENARNVVNKVVDLLGTDSSREWKPFNDSQGKIRSNASWFSVAEGFADKRAAYKVADNNEQNVDLKCYWMKKVNKSIISWLVALTPNFEDEPFYGSLNIGIDFVIPEEANRILVILSKNYIVRIVELRDSLSVTQQDIFNAWLTNFDYSNKSQVHEILWKSFDLEPVNKSFYKGISGFFVELKQYLAEDAKIFDARHAAYFTNRLIGRIVFCWFLNKKGIINPEIGYFETEGLEASKYYRQKLEVLFFKVFNTPLEDRIFKEDQKTPFLNGGLFEIKENDRYGDPELTFPADYFDRLFKFLRHYNFTTDESTASFQQVAIDPEMLGRIFENLLAEQVEETGEQARKAKGAFYTPREIVDYMCRESLREYLKTKIPEDDLRDQRIGLLLDVKPHEFRDQQRNYRSDLKPYKYEILKALDEIKIIDPACGSGAFPMGMLHLLLDIYDRIEATFDPYKKKLDVIKNNLFGVDIEPMAVEICRLRAWLSIIVDEESDSKKIEPLPNLDFKFICANSLVPLLKADEKMLFDTVDKDQLIEIREKYFNARTFKSKEILRGKFEKAIDYKGEGNMFSSEREKQLRSFHPFDSENITSFFDTNLLFGMTDRFDVVIANPPYGANIDNKVDEYRKIYPRSIKNYAEIYKLFFEFCLSALLRVKSGVLVFITPNTYLTQSRYKDLRAYLLEHNVIEILNLGEDVFDATVPVCISIIKNERDSNGKYRIADLTKNNKYIGTLNGREFKEIKQHDLSGKRDNSFIQPYVLKDNELFLSDVLEIKDGGIQYHRSGIGLKNKGGNDLYVRIFQKRGEGRFVRSVPTWYGKLIDAYYISENTDEEFNLDYKTILKANESVSFSRQAFDMTPRILWRQTAPYLKAVLDEKKRYFRNTIQCAWVKQEWAEKVIPDYIVAILNSSYLRYVYNKMVRESGRVFPQVKIGKVKILPLRIPSMSVQKRVSRLVEEICQQKKNNPKADIKYLQTKIDEEVFEIYGVEKSEVKAVAEMLNED